MLRKLRVINIALILILAMTCFSAAADEVVFRVYNPNSITSDLDATYVQGDISKAKGQTVKIANTGGTVAEKKLPYTGKRYTFRIKIPKEEVKEKGTNSYAVTAYTATGKKIRTTYVRIKYKEKKKQKIKVDKKEYKVELPGDPVAIDAESSAGLELDYSSSNEDVVKVDKNGKLEPVGGGTAEISVSQSNDSKYEDASKTIKVSVKELPHYTIRFHLGKNASEITGADEEVIQQTAFVKTLDGETSDEQLAVNDDEDTVVEQKIAVGKKTDLLSAGEKKGDYEFLGWSESSTGYPEYDGAEAVTDLAGKDETIDLYAVWHGERAQEAIEWATMIANDNSWTYGQGTFKCHVCGTAPKKQYTCMPFLAAAYAHGPEDPIMLSGGRHVMNLHDGNFQGELGQIWEKIGLCKNLSIDDLRPGDVVIKWASNNASGHAWMYGGDDKVIEAAPNSSGPNSIAVKSGAAAKLRRYGSSEGTPSKNYVMRYKY